MKNEKKTDTKDLTILHKVWKLISENLGTKLVSVAIAVVLWGVVLGSRHVEVTKEIPLEVTTSPDVVPSTDVPEKITFRLSGPKAFLRSILDRREDPIRVNLVGAKPALITYRFFSDSIRVPIGVKVLSISPASVLIKLEYIREKEVPVHVEIAGKPPEPFQLTSVEVAPEMVRIKGPESRLENIHSISTLPVDVSGMTQSVSREVPLDLTRNHVHLVGDVPRVTFKIEPLSANFRIKNVDIHVISSHKVRVEEKSLTVLVRATPSDLEKLDRTQVYGVIDLSDKEKGQYHEPVQMTLPPQIGLVKVIPDRVHVTLY